MNKVERVSKLVEEMFLAGINKVEISHQEDGTIKLWVNQTDRTVISGKINAPVREEDKK